MSQVKKAVIVPCSGIGKTYGTVSREAAYEVTEELKPSQTQLVALSLLVLGNEEARAAVAQNPTITIDGCKLACATKMVEESGGAADFGGCFRAQYCRSLVCRIVCHDTCIPAPHRMLSEIGVPPPPNTTTQGQHIHGE